jgi:thiamine transporter
MIFSYIYGTKKGLLVGFLYGVLQAVQDPWLIHPAQFLLDYPIAFSMVCFAGTLTDLKVLNKLPQVKFGISAIIAGSLRFFCHILSGVFAFGAYAVDSGATNFWSYSLIYNLYVFIDIALVVFAGCIILSSKAFNKEIEKFNPMENQIKEIEE